MEPSSSTLERRQPPAPDAPIALVTGANRGLGFETCRQLGERGYRVVLTSRAARDGKAAAAQLADDGLAAEHRRLDVTKAADIATIAEGIRAEGERLSVLVNNAAVSLDGFNADVARETLAANFFGAMHLTDALIELIEDGGTIVMVSSGMGELANYGRALKVRFADPELTREGLSALADQFVADVGQGQHRQAGWPSSAYRVSKTCLNGLARVLARELQPRGIRVNAVCPGWVRTRMGSSAASRSVSQGASSIVWAATLEETAAGGGFYRDGRAIAW